MVTQRHVRSVLEALVIGLFCGGMFAGVLIGLDFVARREHLSGGGLPTFVLFIAVTITGYRMGKLCARMTQAIPTAMLIVGAVLWASVYILRLHGRFADIPPMVMAMVFSWLLGNSIVSAQKGGKDAQDRRLKP